MRKLFILFSILMLSKAQILVADTGSAESTSGSLTSMPPAAPALLSPANGETEVVSSELTWNATTHAASYHIQVSTESYFSSTIADESGLTETTYTVSGLSGDVTYYWHVDATNVAGTGSYSETWNFTTHSAILVTLSLFTAEAVDAGVLVKWITESEINVVGFILERSTPLEARNSWQIIASYQTHDALKSRGDMSSQTDYKFTDTKIECGNTYQYRLSQVNTDGHVHIQKIIQIDVPMISSTGSASTNQKKTTALDPPLPNPFNPQTTISYRLSKAGHVDMSVYDLMGRKVRTLVNGFQSPGRHTTCWRGEDDSGHQMASGIYLIVLNAGAIVQKQKVILVH
ncbi:T9SS type A sorting domain-containing protein [candidate division KSB1 bacterium]|nr:T9SS type A sorting domain-containing protein [candidate division KSB1 bacterium]